MLCWRAVSSRVCRIAFVFLLSLCGLCLYGSIALALGGCGSAQGSAAIAVGQTRTVLDVNDQPIEAPVNPQRVVTLSEPTLDAALSLGVIPIGTTAGRGQSTPPAYLSDLAADIPLVGNVANPNYEEIARVRPDLILVDGTSINNDEVIAILEEIAPVVVCGYAGGFWQINLRITANALNRQEEAKQIEANYERHAAEVSAQLATPYENATFSIVRWQGTSASMILNELPPGRVLLDLGLKRPDNQNRNGRGHAEPVSLENLAEIDADYMFFGTLGGSSVDNPQAGGSADLEGAHAALREAVQMPGFAQLTAYQESHIILVDGSLWTSTGGPLLMNRIIDAVEEALL
ncbi:MAG: iron-siderophore ABC transporter substrate-binding protein [Coriobacteriales bacterium]|nr:iron-siderophore ABC transporter substrate-binding protein [Coriobacteriales bacterium]